MRLTAKPRYLLLLHRGNKKSNTVTALVDSERLFSSASHVLDEKRNRLTCDKAEMLVFVKKNSHARLESQK